MSAPAGSGPPYAVAIVTFGFGSPAGKRALQVLPQYGLDARDVLDMRKVLTDPRSDTSRVRHQVDATDEWTQRAVMSQQAFPDVMQQCVTEADAQAADRAFALVFRACTTGFHRADTVGRTEKEMLNRKVNSAGVRLYNAQHFPLCEVAPRDVEQHLDLAVRWASEPWGLTRGGMNRAREELFGMDAARTRPEASRNLDAVYEWLENVFESMAAPDEVSR